MNKTLFVVLAAALTACSVEPTVSARHQQIINGMPEAGFPGVGIMLLNAEGGVAQNICTGTLVGQTTVLTAAHCLQNTPLNKTFFRLGTTNYDVTALTPNNSWNPSISASDNDVGLVTLANSPGIAALPVSTSAPQVSQAVRLVGYGVTTVGQSGTAGTKRFGQKTIDAVNSADFEIVGSDKNSADGDSGGPVVATIGGTQMIIGIISAGTSDASTTFHARLDIHESWLTNMGGGDVTFANVDVPQVTITTPADQATVNSPFTVSADVTHTRTIASVDVEVDSVVVQTLTATPYSESLTLAPGNHTIKMIARDDQGTPGEDQISVTISAPAGDSGVPGSDAGVPGSDSGTVNADGSVSGGDGGAGGGGSCAIAAGNLPLPLLCLLMAALWRRRRR